MHYVGIDENGMGPRLGPLIVTSIVARVDERGAAIASAPARGALAKRIGDSKKLVAFEDSTLGEAWARTLLTRAGTIVTSPRELLGAILLDREDDLRAPCPSHHTKLCWGVEGESFAADDKLLKSCHRDLDKLADKGVSILGARVAVVCTKRLNEAAARGLSRFDVDLHTMERLALRAHEDAGEEIHAFCGKVGGFGFYGPRFGPLAGRLHTVIVEGRAASEYFFPGLGRLAFVRDADASVMLVGLASLVGKWARDHLMRRVVRFHREHDAELPDASGYHDPVTSRFIEATALLRRKLRVEDACFERVSIGRRSANAAAADET